MNTHNIPLLIKNRAEQLGFDYCKILPISQSVHIDFFKKWIESGRAGDMKYLERNIDKRENPKLLSDDDSYNSIIVLGVNYFQFQLSKEILNDPSRGIIASYAWGDDYHEIIRPLLYELDGFICSITGRKKMGKCLVDTGPVLERSWAHTSGLGFIGKNCCVINPSDGSWMFLSTILIPEVLEYDEKIKNIFEKNISAEDILAGIEKSDLIGKWNLVVREKSQPGTCGKCTRCMNACPTNAFIGPFHLNPLRCISYWTIESKDYIPKELRNLFGNRIFGCDICQEVCPWNSNLEPRTPSLKQLTAYTNRTAPQLIEGFNKNNPYWLDQDAFSLHFSKSPVKRAKRIGMLRNVCIALGNWANPYTVDQLAIALSDIDPLPRGHAAWALGQILRKHNSESAMKLLMKRVEVEDDNEVRKELSEALM